MERPKRSKIFSMKKTRQFLSLRRLASFRLKSQKLRRKSLDDDFRKQDSLQISFTMDSSDTSSVTPTLNPDDTPTNESVKCLSYEEKIFDIEPSNLRLCLNEHDLIKSSKVLAIEQKMIENSELNGEEVSSTKIVVEEEGIENGKSNGEEETSTNIKEEAMSINDNLEEIKPVEGLTHVLPKDNGNVTERVHEELNEMQSALGPVCGMLSAIYGTMFVCALIAIILSPKWFHDDVLRLSSQSLMKLCDKFKLIETYKIGQLHSCTMKFLIAKISENVSV